MNDRLEFGVDGPPIPQGSMMVRLVKGRPILTPSNSHELKSWRRDVAAAARTHMLFRRPWPPQAPVAVTLAFAFLRPESIRRPLPSVKPDVDKLSRAILDALTDAKVWADDGQVVLLTASKTYSERAGVRIRVRDADLPPRQA